MKNLFLTSSMSCALKINGERFSQSFDNTNGIRERIKDKIEKEDVMIIFSSNPDDFEKNDMYNRVISESFNKSGFNFKEYIFIDNRYTGNLEEDINKSNLIFLSGGHTPTQMKYFEKLNLRKLLKNYEGIIIGQSAGSLNMAHLVVCGPEGTNEIGMPYTWKGLGLTNINIEPHFVTTELVDAEDILVREELLKLSEEYKIYALVDGTDIYDDGITQTMYGEGYLIENKKIKKICNKNENIKL